MISKRDSQQKLRSQARFLKLRLQELFPKEVCKKHRRRNWILQQYEQRQKELKEKQYLTSKHTTSAHNFYRYTCPASDSKLKLKQHFKPQEIEKMMDEKQYYFGDEQKYRKLTQSKQHSPRQQQQQRTKTMVSPKHTNVSEMATTAKSKPKTSQQVYVRKQQLDRDEQLRKREEIFYRNHRKQKYLSEYERGKEKSQKNMQFQHIAKFEKVRTRLQSNFQQERQNQELKELQDQLKRKCWDRVKMHKSLEKSATFHSKQR